MNWHLEQAVVETYANGELAGARAASVEAHLLSCGRCRAMIVPVAPADRLASLWSEIEERVDSPGQSWLERLLGRVRIPADDARLLAAAPSLQLSWLISLAVVLSFAAAATHSGERGVLLFLVLAPLAPVAGVAGAYGRGIDPTYEIACATPYPTHRLLLLRVAAVLTTSLVLTSAVAFTVSEAWVAAGWLLPSLAMVGIALTLCRWIELPMAAATVAAGYLLTVGVVWREDGTVYDLFQATGQLASLAITVACLLIVFGPMHNRAAIRRTR